MRKTIDQISKKFWARVDRSGECWIWKKGKRTGYGILRVNGGRMEAHRLAFELTFGPIPNRRIVCHKCDNPPCVRPDHLFLGTHKDNSEDMYRKGRNAGVVQSKGTQNINAKLNEEAIRAIRWLCANGKSVPRVARAYSIHPSTIYDILKGTTWGHVI